MIVWVTSPRWDSRQPSVCTVLSHLALWRYRLKGGEEAPPFTILVQLPSPGHGAGYHPQRLLHKAPQTRREKLHVSSIHSLLLTHRFVDSTMKETAELEIKYATVKSTSRNGKRSPECEDVCWQSYSGTCCIRIRHLPVQFSAPQRAAVTVTYFLPAIVGLASK